MNQKTKLLLSGSSITTCLFVVGIKIQNLSLILFGFVGLAFFLLRFDLAAAVYGLAVGLVILYVSPHMGWLYGRDSHRAASGAVELLNSGWPTDGYAFTATPLIHLHAAMTGVVSGVPLYPTTSPKVLVTAYLPLLYLVSTFLFISLMIRKVNENASDLPTHVCLLPALFWIPLVKFHSGFRRESVAIVLFAAVVYLLYSNHSGRRARILFLLFSAAIVISHNFSTAMLLAFIGVVITVHKRYSIKQGVGLLSLIFGVIATAWYFVGESGGAVLIGALLGLGQTAVDPTFSGETQASLLTTYQSFLGLWIYQLLLGIGILFGLIYNSSRTERRYFEYALLYGVIVAIGSAIAWASGLIAFNRIMSFFVIACGWIAPVGIHLYTRDRPRALKLIPVKTFLVLLILVGSSVVPMHIVSSQPPNYSEGEFSQRIEPLAYPAADFAERYVEQDSLVATLNLWDVIRVETEQPVVSAPSVISRGVVPPDTAVFLLPRNEDLYASKELSLYPTRLFARFDSNNNAVYSNGKVQIYIHSG